MTNEIVKQDTKEVQAASGYKAFREQCAEACMRATPDRARVRAIGDAAHYVACRDAVMALPLPESSIQHKNMICMAECMDMVRSELIEIGIIDSSVPPMMIADAVGDKLKESAEALRKESKQLISIAKRWLAIGGGAWNASRYENEKDRLESDTRAVIEALKGGAA